MEVEKDQGARAAGTAKTETAERRYRVLCFHRCRTWRATALDDGFDEARWFTGGYGADFSDSESGRDGDGEEGCARDATTETTTHDEAKDTAAMAYVAFLAAFAPDALLVGSPSVRDASAAGSAPGPLDCARTLRALCGAYDAMAAATLPDEIRDAVLLLVLPSRIVTYAHAIAHVGHLLASPLPVHHRVCDSSSGAERLFDDPAAEEDRRIRIRGGRMYQRCRYETRRRERAGLRLLWPCLRAAVGYDGRVRTPCEWRYSVVPSRCSCGAIAFGYAFASLDSDAWSEALDLSAGVAYPRGEADELRVGMCIPLPPPSLSAG